MSYRDWTEGEQYVAEEALRALELLGEIHSLDDYMLLACRTLAPDVAADEFKTMMNAATGMGSETGEVLEILKKRFFHGHPRTPESDVHLQKELGDQLWYWALMCRVHGFKPSQIAAMNIQKLRARYPEGFLTTERSINRAANDI